MRILFAFLMLASCTAFCGDEQFNGRWDITPKGERPRGWWLEIEGAGTPAPKGKFVSAFNGDLNIIQEIAIKDGELRFGWVRKERLPDGSEGRTMHLVYTARLAGNDRIQGTSGVEGGSRKTEFTGVRAPEVKDKDDASWREGKPVKLFDGKSLAGWNGIIKGRETGWTVENGSLTSFGKGMDIASAAKFWNFKLHVEYRIREHSNSGIGLRGRYEIQIMDDYGRPQNTHTSGALYSRIPASVNASKPVGEWQVYDIRLVGRDLTVAQNGKTVLDKVHVDGLTAMAIDANEGEPGPVTLQGDHGFVEFRDITVTPLVKR